MLVPLAMPTVAVICCDHLAVNLTLHIAWCPSAVLRPVEPELSNVLWPSFTGNGHLSKAQCLNDYHYASYLPSLIASVTIAKNGFACPLTAAALLSWLDSIDIIMSFHVLAMDPWDI